jgi:hypothetical protein
VDDDEWATPRFQILYAVGLYTIKDVGMGMYKLVRDIDTGGNVESKEIGKSNDRAYLTILAEEDLLKTIKETDYHNSRMQYFAETMCLFIELIDRIVAYKVEKGQAVYDYVKLREKITAFIRVKFCIGFFYRGFISSFIEMIKTKKKANDILKSILFSMLLMVRREIKERLDENTYTDKQWIAILYDISDIERRIFKLRFGKQN